MKRTNLLADSKIAALYQGVPAAEMDEFRRFLRTHPYREFSYQNEDWAYIITEPREETVLLLPGALCAPEVSWKSISGLEDKYRVIAPEYPPVKSMDTLVEGIAAILRREGIDHAHVVGGSYGGFVAQIFARRHPRFTRSLVLSHTLPPNSEGEESIRKATRTLSLLPGGLLRWIMGKRLGGLMPERTEETAGLHAIYQEMLHYRLTKADILGILWRTADFHDQKFSPADLSTWNGRMLILLADNDPGTPDEVRARLTGLYPQAKVHLFHGSGHATAVTQQEEYQKVILEFLQANP